MAGDDSDFAAYLTARWTPLVRTLILLGQDRAGAEATARDGLARCRADWERVRRADDVDVHLYRAVLDLRRPAVDRTLTAGSDDDTALLQDVDARLRSLSAEQREPQVLGAVAGLSEAQVADVLDTPIDTVARRTADATVALGSATIRRAAGTIAVSAVPLEDVLADSRRRQRRRRRLVTAGVVGVLAVGATVWAGVAGSGSDESKLPPPQVTRVRNPVDVSWYADGALRLDQVRVEVPPLTDLAELNGGVVYGDEDGVVAFVAADGQRRRLGSKDPDVPLVASADEGWAAWIDPDDAQLVAYDVSVGEPIATYDAGDTEVLPVAIDQRRVFFDTPEGSYAWAPGVGDPEPLGRGGVVDVESATRVFQVGSDIEMEQGFFNVSFTRRGIGALLSPGGTFVLSRPAGSEPGAPYRPLLYDTRSGKAQPLGLGLDEQILDATFGDNYHLIYLVAPRPGSDPDALLVLRTCDLDIALCSNVSPVTQADHRPLLAR